MPGTAGARGRGAKSGSSTSFGWPTWWPIIALGPKIFERRACYKSSLIRGRSRVENANKVGDIARNGPWFATSRVPYRWLPLDLNQAGYFCIFAGEFPLPVKSGVVVELPIFQPRTSLVLEVLDKVCAAIGLIF